MNFSEWDTDNGEKKCPSQFSKMQVDIEIPCDPSGSPKPKDIQFTNMENKKEAANINIWEAGTFL